MFNNASSGFGDGTRSPPTTTSAWSLGMGINVNPVPTVVTSTSGTGIGLPPSTPLSSTAGGSIPATSEGASSSFTSSFAPPFASSGLRTVGGSVSSRMGQGPRNIRFDLGGEGGEESDEEFQDAEERKSTAGSEGDGRGPRRSSGFISNSMLIQSIEPFRGTTDEATLDSFLSAISHAAKINGWNRSQKFDAAYLKLKGEALRIVQVSKCINWEQLRTVLKARYGSKELRAVTRRKAAACAQRPNEDVTSYAERLKSLFVKLQPEGFDPQADKLVRKLVNESVCDRYIEGLKPSIRRAVLSKAPTSFEEAIEVAVLEEQIDMLEYKAGRVHLNEGRVDHPLGYCAQQCVASQVVASQKSSKAGGDENQAQTAEQVRVSNLPQRSSAFNVECYNCRERGHYARDCTKRKAIVCYGCNEPGHMRHECPNQGHVPQRQNRRGHPNGRPTRR